MESRFYYFYGQTPENTKIGDREHALHITRNAWDDITKHLDRKKLIQEALDKEKAHRKALKEGSEAMTKNWDNSIENIRKRKEEEREKRMGIKEVDKLQKYYTIRKEQEAQREDFIKKVRIGMFRDKGPCKELTSALLASEMLLERQKQLEMNEMIKQHYIDEERLFAEKVKKDAEDEKREKEAAEGEVAQKRKAMGEFMRKELAQARETAKLKKEKRIRKEAEDFVRAREELEECKKLEEQLKLKKKWEKKHEQEKDIKRQEEQKAVLAREEKEMEEVVALYAETKKRMDCMKKQKDRETTMDSCFAALRLFSMANMSGNG